MSGEYLVVTCTSTLLLSLDQNELKLTQPVNLSEGPETEKWLFLRDRGVGGGGVAGGARVPSPNIFKIIKN